MKTITMVTIDSVKFDDFIKSSGDTKADICTCVLNKSPSYIHTCLKKSKMNYNDYQLLCNYLNIDESICKIATEEVVMPDKFGNGRCKKIKRYDHNVAIDGQKLKEQLTNNCTKSLTELSISYNKHSNYLSNCIHKNMISGKVLKKICREYLPGFSTKDFKVLDSEVSKIKTTISTSPEITEEKPNNEPVVPDTNNFNGISLNSQDISIRIKDIYELIDETKQLKKNYEDKLKDTYKWIKTLKEMYQIDLSDLIKDI